MRILLVEDESSLADALLDLLRSEGYSVDLATTGNHAAELASLSPYDLVILDWSIPPPSGLDLLAQWRGQGSEVPVLMLTGHTDLEDRIDGLDSGADDYLTKPFPIAELLARVRSLLRRRERPLQDVLSAGDLVMDRTAHRVTVAGQPLDLSPKEFAVLEQLLLYRGRVLDRSHLAEHAWDRAFDPLSNVIDVTVHRLRKKIEAEGQESLLLTVKGVGYMIRGEQA